MHYGRDDTRKALRDDARRLIEGHKLDAGSERATRR